MSVVPRVFGKFPTLLPCSVHKPVINMTSRLHTRFPRINRDFHEQKRSKIIVLDSKSLAQIMLNVLKLPLGGP